MADIPPPLSPDDPEYVPLLDDPYWTPTGLVGLPYHFDRDGNVINFRQWGQLQREEYDRVAQDHLDEGNIWISTVWLGMNHNWTGSGPPIIFETMVFVRSTAEQVEARRQRWAGQGWAAGDFPWEDLQCQRWSTEDEAREGHRAMVDSLRFKIEMLTEADPTS